MTISIGFRAPSIGEIFQDYGKELEGLLGNDTRFSDPQRNIASAPGQLCNADIKALQSLLLAHVNDTKTLATWFGAYMTEPKNDELLPLADRVDIDDGFYNCVVRDAVTRVAYYESEDHLLWCCNGETQELHGSCAEAAKILADNSVISLDMLTPALSDEVSREWMNELLEQGHFHLYE